MNNLLNSLIIVPRKFIFEPYYIDTRLNINEQYYKGVSGGVLRGHGELYVLKLHNRCITSYSDSYNLMIHIFEYYHIDIKSIMLKETFNISNRAYDFLYDYFFKNMPNIIKTSNKPQVVYFEEDFDKISSILDKQIVDIDDCLNEYYVIPSNDILIFNNIIKRTKINLIDTTLIYE